MLARSLSIACLILAGAMQSACTMPARAADTADAATDGAASARAAAPSVTSLVPNSGPTSGGTAVTVNGVNFAPGATVAFDGEGAPNVTFVSATKLTCTTPGHAAGAVSVVVTNPDTQNSTLANGFTYGGPVSITGVTPHIGTTNGGTAVAIAGANFATGATVTFGGAAATNVVFVSTTQLTCVTPTRPAGAAVVDVVVTNFGVDSGTLSSGFVYKPAPAPAIACVVPPSGTTNGGTAVRIKGAHFAKGATVAFAGIAATNVTFVSNKRLTCVIPALPAGSGPVVVVVTNPDTQSGALYAGFTYILAYAPSIAHVTPSAGTSNGGTTVRIRGAHFADGATVRFGGTAVTNLAFANHKLLICTTPARAAGAGTVNVVVTNPDAKSSIMNNAFTYRLARAPWVGSVTPDNGTAIGGTAVTITGAHFVVGATVSFGGSSASAVTFVSTSQLTCTTPGSSPGPVAVIVTNPDTQSFTVVHGFTYDAVVPAPVVVSVTPGSGPVAGLTSVTINGANFVNGATVTFGGAGAGMVNFVNPTQLVCATPAHAEGVVDVVVTNPDSQSSTLSNGFVYFVPR